MFAAAARLAHLFEPIIHEHLFFVKYQFARKFAAGRGVRAQIPGGGERRPSGRGHQRQRAWVVWSWRTRRRQRCAVANRFPSGGSGSYWLRKVSTSTAAAPQLLLDLPSRRLRVHGHKGQMPCTVTARLVLRGRRTPPCPERGSMLQSVRVARDCRYEAENLTDRHRVPVTEPFQMSA